MTAELVIFQENKTDLVALFTPGGADPLIKMIKDEVAKFEPDLTTEKGRKEIASIAYKVAKAKNRLDDLGKERNEEYRKIIEGVNSERNRIKDEMQAIQDEVRKPLTEWEEANERRIEGHQAALQEIDTDLAIIRDNWETILIEHIRAAISKLANDARVWEEFSFKAKTTKESALAQIQKYLEMRLKADADKAELERLRLAEEARKQKEREELIAKEAAEKAKKEAEEKAERDRLEAETKAKAEKDAIEARERAAAAKAEQDRLASLQREKDAEERAKAAENARIAQEQKAAKDAEDAKLKLAEQQRIAKANAEAAALKAKQDAENAAAAERTKIAAEQKRVADETAKREANVKHKAKINNDALYAILSFVFSDDPDCLNEYQKNTGKQLVEAIAKGQIPHVTINY